MAETNTKKQPTTTPKVEEETPKLTLADVLAFPLDGHVTTTTGTVRPNGTKKARENMEDVPSVDFTLDIKWDGMTVGDALLVAARPIKIDQQDKCRGLTKAGDMTAFKKAHPKPEHWETDAIHAPRVSAQVSDASADAHYAKQLAAGEITPEELVERLMAKAKTIAG